MEVFIWFVDMLHFLLKNGPFKKIVTSDAYQWFVGQVIDLDA